MQRLSWRHRLVGRRSGRERNVAHALVTTRAAIHVERVVTRKRTPAVVTLQAVITRAGEVLEDLDVRHLTRVRDTGDHVVTFIAAHALSRSVILMSEDRAEIVFRLERAVIRPKRMTGRATSDRRFRRMAGEAVVVRRDADRNGLARAGRLMAMCAACGRTSFARLVRRMIELHAKALDEFRGKRFHRRRRDVHPIVTDRTHRRLFAGVRKLTQVTTDARVVSSKFKLFLFGITTMTGNAVKFFVFVDRVVEF